MATIRVSNQNQLNTALANVKGGDTVLLAPGRYAELNLMTGWAKDFQFNKKVTIASANASNPAIINQMYMRDVSNVELSDLKFVHNGTNASGTPAFRRNAPYFIERGDNVTIDDSVFRGAVKNGYGTDIGLRLKDSVGVTVSDSSFANFFNGMNIVNNKDLKLVRNVITGMAHDGMTLGGITGALIERNEFRNFKSPNPDSQHKDNIQFRVDHGEPASKNIVIRNNVIDSAEVRHGIYFGNELVKTGVKSGATYENILIEDNHIRSAQTHGITVFHGNGIHIRDNVIEQNPDKGFNTHGRMNPIINVSKWSDNVTITGNEVASVQRPQNSSWTVSNNDTGPRQLLHWDGTVYGPYSAKNYGAILREPLTDVSSLFSRALSQKALQLDWNGAGDELRFNGKIVDGDTRIDVTGFDVPGDTLVLSDFGAGTFNSLPDDNRIVVWNDGRAVRIDSLADFHELDRGSDRIDVYTSTVQNALIMEIEFGRGEAQFVFHGLGSAFRSALDFE